MTDPLTPSPSPQTSTQAAPRRRWPLVAAVAVAAALTGAAATSAFSQGGFGPPWARPGFMGPSFVGPGFMGGRLDPAQAEDKADRLVRHFAIEIDATAQQQERLREIVKAAVKDIIPLREQAQAGRERARTLLTQPTIDRAAIEAFRTDRMTLADTASKRIAQAVADAAEVLTPEQRRKIDERITARRAYWQWGHRG
jgi:periplasmic protein CpxP/Spy